MTKAQLLKTIFNLNEPFLKEKGFIADKKNFEFIKTDADGYEKIQISCAAVGTRFYLTYGLLLRINKLEEFVKPFSGAAETYWKDSASILISAIHLKGDINNMQYIVEKDEDIATVNEDFINLMNEKGFAWFDKYMNNISILDSELNDDKPINPEYLQMLMRPLYGIAAAYLDNNPRLSEIIKKHKTIWEERAGQTAESKRNLERIEKLVQHIENL
ncbi:MAG: hypothetical protein ABIN74_00970 [Ferruginibacter sp.]